MKVQFADTFSKSIKRLIWHESKIYKFYSFFRYDIARFLKNVWKFRKPLANHYWWDHHATLQFLEISLSNMAENMEKYGNEIDGPRLKKVAKMKRAAELIQNYNKDLYIDMAEAELGEIVHHPWEFEDVPDKPGYSRLIDQDTEEEKIHNRKIYDRAREIEQQEWNELWQIIKGQDRNEYRNLTVSLTEEEQKEEDQYYKWFDGSGLNGWWD
jgi:hypothetical protein